LQSSATQGKIPVLPFGKVRYTAIGPAANVCHHSIPITPRKIVLIVSIAICECSAISHRKRSRITMASES
jgi:hypothetical protein